jgi:Protein of unknown function (DUF1353)
VDRGQPEDAAARGLQLLGRERGEVAGPERLNRRRRFHPAGAVERRRVREYRNASVVHDVACDTRDHPWQDVHRMFYEACRAGGVGEQKAKLVYAAVYHFGPKWAPGGASMFFMRTMPVEEEFVQLKTLWSRAIGRSRRSSRSPQYVTRFEPLRRTCVCDRSFAPRTSRRQADQAGTDWPAYGRDPGGSRYSLAQINRSNVKSLRIAWTHRTGRTLRASVQWHR